MVNVVTLGCRINTFESEILKEKLSNIDNLIIVNTCAVTGEAERQCRQTIRKLRKENPDAKIIVTGCAAQIAPKKYAEMDEVDLVLGNKEKSEIEKYIMGDITEKSIVGDIFSYDDYDKYLITSFDGREKRAFVQVQQGCDHRCTYCIVPYARGNNRSVPKEDVIKQIKELLNSGYNEICLTGVDICSYKPSFSDLVESILSEIPQLPSLQFGSLDPAAVDDKFILLTKDKRMNPHFHLSVQAGDNLILKRMKRRHTREDVIRLCREIRKARTDATFGSDFICGFPTETDEAFANTILLVDEAGIDKLHVFPYSERKGTPAALMPQVPVEIRKQRAKILREKREVSDD